MTTRASTNCPKSDNNFCNQIISHAMIIAPFYSAYVLNSATIGYFLLFQLTTPLPKENMKPSIYLLFETLPT
jgi:hypothetical protein